MTMRPIVNVMLLVIALAACGQSARTSALRSSLTALNVARDTLITVSDERQAQIVDDCARDPACTVEIGKARLVEFRHQRTPIVEAFARAYEAISTAALLNDAKSVGDVAVAVAHAVKLVKELKR